MQTYVTDREAELIGLARGGDERAYGDLVGPHRPTLHAHCYRMLGSLEDADDALQESLLRAWRGLGRFEGRSSVRTWLYRIATNCCLQLLKRRPKRLLSPDYAPPRTADSPPGRTLPESAWLGPYPDEPFAAEDQTYAPAASYEHRETVELAFVAALQHLPPRQRAVLLLREVLDFSAREAADLLETSVPSVNSSLQRARRAVGERVPAQSQQATLRALGDERCRDLVTRYMDALDRADLGALLRLLTDEPVWTMPPVTTWYRGRADVTAYLKRGPFTVRWRHLPARASGQLAVGCYIWDDERGDYAAEVLDVLTVQGDRIAEVTAFIDPRLFARFGLPERIAE